MLIFKYYNECILEGSGHLSPYISDKKKNRVVTNYDYYRLEKVGILHIKVLNMTFYVEFE